MPVCGLIFIAFLLETSRVPFDLAEAEAELVSGYHTEYGGFLFATYYLGEYFHLYFFALALVIFFLGGWENPNFIFSVLLRTNSDFGVKPIVLDFTLVALVNSYYKILLNMLVNSTALNSAFKLALFDFELNY